LKRDADDELGALAASLNDTSRQLRDHIERLSLESGRREAILAGMVEGVLAEAPCAASKTTRLRWQPGPGVAITGQWVMRPR
jgi:hypothetical protein